jgi:hypothetical protein
MKYLSLAIVPLMIGILTPAIFSLIRKSNLKKEAKMDKNDFIMCYPIIWAWFFLGGAIIISVILLLLNIFEGANIVANILVPIVIVIFVLGVYACVREKIVVNKNTIKVTPTFGKIRIYTFENIKKLKELEDEFFEYYPKAWEDEKLLPIIKRFSSSKFQKDTKEFFKKSNFSQPELICESFAKIISRSPLISLFEKPKVRDAIKSMSVYEKDMFSIALEQMLFGDFKDGLEDMVEILAPKSLAKWSIITLIPYYFYPTKEFFIKPTTTKEILKYFEIENLVYKPKPTFEFYSSYTKVLNSMKKEVSKKLTDDNAGFTGFLRMSMEDYRN